MLFAIHDSVIGLPDENTTTVGMPVPAIALTRALCAPTRLRLLTSTCSPVLKEHRGLVPRHNSQRREEERILLRGIVSRPKFILISGPCTNDNDCDIRLLSCSDGFCEPRLVVTPAFTSLSIIDGYRVANGCSNSV